MYFIKMIGKAGQSGFAAADQSVLGQPPRRMPPDHRNQCPI